MSSPFPGMNPYLESDLWTDLHAELALATKHQLTPLLRPNDGYSKDKETGSSSLIRGLGCGLRLAVSTQRIREEEPVHRAFHPEFGRI